MCAFLLVTVALCSSLLLHHSQVEVGLSLGTRGSGTRLYQTIRGCAEWVRSSLFQNTMDAGGASYPNCGIEEIAKILKIKSYSQRHATSDHRHSLSVKSLPNDAASLLPEEAFVMTADELPSERYMATVGNGHVGTVVDSDTVLMNGLYNGPGGHSHRARIPSMVACNITRFEPTPQQEPKRYYTLNMMNGMYLETIHAEDFILEKKVYAHRTLKHLFITEFDVIRIRKEGQTPLKVFLSGNPGGRSADVKINKLQCMGKRECSYWRGETYRAETSSSHEQNVHIYFDAYPDYLEVPPVPATQKTNRTKWIFFASFSQNRVVAEQYYDVAAGYASSDFLVQSHVAAWQQLWMRGSITMVGNLPLAKAVAGAMYYILNSLQLKYDPEDPFIGLSPSDLAHGVSGENYLGHVFWDQDTWMYPGILMFYPDLGKLLLSTRLRTRAAAEDNARNHRKRGAQFPWESAYTGSEVCPEEIYADNEVHITADIAFAFRQYMYMTHDLEFYLTEGGRDLLNEISEFWASRITYDHNIRKYEILKVMPPDEYKREADNSVTTNYVASLALRADHDISQILQIEPTGASDWVRFADKLIIPFDERLKYHPEYDGYDKGDFVKQADVILLGFPFMMEMPEQVRRNDLTFYESVTDDEGPAMTWTMFAIGWLELGEKAKAYELLMKNMEHIHQPFQIWSESIKGEGAVNFITGMGGLIQSMIFGYGGIRIRPDHLEFNPCLPEDVTTLNLTGISYRGGVFTFSIQNDKLSVTLTAMDFPFLQFIIKVESTGHQVSLKHNIPVTVDLEKAQLIRTN